uniref:Mediator complex subunit 15 KIX domain-containing protein n=1 Tax=Heterosigma akashiwo TaxID=2829 RepID=A0A6S9GEG3_HETAK|mmetsp:Transcript_12126/g.21658  ORF Transcript_12126/g.21658 Transcript_12126/m.21658 type:complete len:191 (+) Transcript_12126:112-684(+)|eukprot:CAMPEP_0194712272 /NCGR_PEP_ID=MMETSP0296-20130528/4425_1 /TAXON_ID=39354 /ORGANISM="Heterosigma akashiwo, Strain CCMP2393" /LENGTH=190 /DNA_ID=CAMNT_0039610633 /DNA_START=107 /DNA_END=679 /DNA_ORIENTATION=+
MASVPIKEVGIVQDDSPPGGLQSGTNPPPLSRTNSDIRPVLVRTNSSNQPVQRQLTQQPSMDWHLCLTIEERQAIRDKVQAAYRAACPDYASLLEVAAAIEEEALFATAPSRLDYFRSGILYSKRVADKQKALNPLAGLAAAAAAATAAPAAVAAEDDNSNKGSKRVADDDSKDKASSPAPKIKKSKVPK